MSESPFFKDSSSDVDIQPAGELTFHAEKLTVSSDSLCFDMCGQMIVNLVKVNKLVFNVGGKEHIFLKVEYVNSDGDKI